MGLLQFLRSATCLMSLVAALFAPFAWAFEKVEGRFFVGWEFVDAGWVKSKHYEFRFYLKNRIMLDFKFVSEYAFAR